jgi:predicted dienelactone hydrolase
VLLVLGACGVFAVLALRPGNARAPRVPAAVGTATSAPSTTSTPSTSVVRRLNDPASLATPGTYPVGTIDISIVEPGTPSRDLPTEVWYPAMWAAAGATPDRAAGPYPLLVFSQGYDVSIGDYHVLLQEWASAGFVVAAPRYPHTSASEPAELDEADIVNHPEDLRFVLTTLLRVAGAPGSALSGLIDSGQVGLVGHSDGGDVSLAVADNSCCQDSRVKAVAVLSGAELTSFGGRYFAGPPVPLLVVQGSADTVNVPACSAQIYDSAPSPKWYLDLLGAEHYPPYVSTGQDQSIVASVVTDFFDLELRGQTGAATAMLARGNVPQVASITRGPSAPPAPGACPGAPA